MPLGHELQGQFIKHRSTETHNKEQSMSESPTYLLERTFDAPREAVWRAWTDAELVCLEQAVGNMGKGWEMGMDLLAKQLAEI